MWHLLFQIMAGIGTIVCFFLILNRLFPSEGVLLGILGIVFWPYAFIWGWLNVAKLRITWPMVAWSLLLVVDLCLFGNLPRTFFN